MANSIDVPVVILKQSSLRNQSSVDPAIAFQPARRIEIRPGQQLIPVQTLTNKYYLAGTARTKLAYEAEESDLNLLRLVGHANFLDRLQDDIESAEKLHETRHKARISHHSVSPKQGTIKWADSRKPELDEDSDDDETSSDSEGEEEILELVRVPTRYRLPQGGSKSNPKREESVPAKSQQTKAVQVAPVLPQIVEEDEIALESVTAHFQTLYQPAIVVGSR